MDNDPFDGGLGSPVGGMPEMPTPDYQDFKASTGGSRTRAIVVIVIVAIAVIGVLIYLNGKQKEAQKYENLRASFQKAHAAGYEKFWKKIDVDLKMIKSTEDLQNRIMVSAGGNQVKFAQRIREECLKILDVAMVDYKFMVPLPGVEHEVKSVIAAAENFRDTWDLLSKEYLKLKDFYDAKDILPMAFDQWLGRQEEPTNEDFARYSIRYVRVLSCIFGGKNLAELDFASMESAVAATCATEAKRPEWFRLIASECLPRLASPAAPDAIYEAALEHSKTAKDTTSRFGIDKCLKDSKLAYDAEEIGKVGSALAEYVKAEKALIKAIDAKLKKL